MLPSEASFITLKGQGHNCFSIFVEYFDRRCISLMQKWNTGIVMMQTLRLRLFTKMMGRIKLSVLVYYHFELFYHFAICIYKKISHIFFS